MLEPHGVTDVHGVGETAIPPARPAIGNAISRAVGCHFLDLPITPEKVLRALNQQKLTESKRHDWRETDNEYAEYKTLAAGRA